MNPFRVALILLVTVLLASACAGVPEVEPEESLPEYRNYLGLGGAGVAIPDGWRFRPPFRGDSFETLYRFDDGSGTAYGSLEEQRTEKHNDDDFLSHVDEIVLAPADRRHTFRLMTDSGSLPVVGARLVPGWELYTTSIPLGETRFLITAVFDTTAYDDPWLLFQSIVLSVSSENPDLLVRRFSGSTTIRLSLRKRNWVGEDDGAVYFEREALGGEVRVGVHVADPGVSWERVDQHSAVAVRAIDVQGEELFLSYTYPCLPEEGQDAVPVELIDEVIHDIDAGR
ncbi:MAG: hypothetical protein GVY29_07405 [Spirochaetes bacterium]|jgi:hypothetical protein|nr:hypothetical protein [Spirochaetota bacterium]